MTTQLVFSCKTTVVSMAQLVEHGNNNPKIIFNFCIDFVAFTEVPLN